MLELKFIRENTGLVQEAIEKRQDTAPLDEILQLNLERRLPLSKRYSHSSLVSPFF